MLKCDIIISVIIMELLQLKYFCDAAKTENFSKTAQKFMVPSSNISQTVHRLEKELGTQLFDRSANRIHLNKNGYEFYSRVSQALRILDEAKKAVNDDALSGEIKICICTNRRIITQVIERFKRDYPEVSFVIHHTVPSETDDFDIIISDKLENEKNYTKTEIITENIVLAMRNDNPLRKCEKISSENLMRERFITMSPPSSLYRYTMSACEQMKFLPDIAIQSDDPYYIRKYVSLGLGVSFVPEESWRGMFDDNVVFRNLDNLKRTTYVFVNNKKYLSKRTELFIENLK